MKSWEEWRPLVTSEVAAATTYLASLWAGRTIGLCILLAIGVGMMVLICHVLVTPAQTRF
jgi:hypothetical protein